jgi:beta-xylosidase
MKKQMLFLFILSFVLAACSSPSAPIAAPTIPIIPTNTIVPTPTIAPSPTPDLLLFKDDFNGSIDSGWKIQNVNKKMYLTNKSGWLEIIARSPLGTKNYFLRQIPEGNFELETKMIFEPVANYQIAGLIIYYNTANYILFGRAYCKTCLPDGDGFYMDNVKRKYIEGSFVTPAPGTDTVFLSLRREGDTYTSYSSEDGSNWTQIGVHTSTMKPRFVGLAAGQSTSGSRPAQFDYFVINKVN